jgi:phosphoglycerate dehydrogenase-like enzyme
VEALTIAVLPARAQALLEERLPGWVDARWWSTPEQLVELAPQAEIGWFDLHVKPPALRAIALAQGLRWLNTSYAGVDWMPLGDLQQRGVALTCGSGLTATQVAEWAVLSLLAVAKGYREVVRAQDRSGLPGSSEDKGREAVEAALATHSVLRQI